MILSFFLILIALLLFLTSLGEGGRSAVQLVKGIDTVSAMGGERGSLRATNSSYGDFNCATESAGIDEEIEKYPDRSVIKSVHSVFSDINKTKDVTAISHCR